MQPTTSSDPLAVLFADRKIGAASKLAFLQLFRFAGGEPGRVVITADWLGGVCGRSSKAAWLWLAELESHDLVKLGERNERRGTIVIDVYNPCPGNREATPDFQQRFPLSPAATSSATSPPIGVEVSAPKPPRPLVPRKVEEEFYQGTKAPEKSMNSTDSMRFVSALARAVVGQADPAEQKMRLKNEVLRVCGGTAHVAEWVAGSAANLVAYHGVPLEEFNQILCDVQAMRAADSLRDAGAFVHSKFRRLAARRGVPWPRSAGS
jgi:hypothetical protein